MEKIIFLEPLDFYRKAAQCLSESLFDAITDSGLGLKSIYLKADAITSFCALFVSDAEDFLKEEFRNVFILARKYKIQSEDELFSISFLFTPDTKFLREQALLSDGYVSFYRRPHLKEG